MQHEPRRLLPNVDSAVKFVAGNAVLAIANHPNCRHPLVERNRRVLEDRSKLHSELLLTAVAETNLLRLHKRVFSNPQRGHVTLPFGQRRTFA